MQTYTAQPGQQQSQMADLSNPFGASTDPFGGQAPQKMPPQAGQHYGHQQQGDPQQQYAHQQQQQMMGPETDPFGGQGMVAPAPPRMRYLTNLLELLINLNAM